MPSVLAADTASHGQHPALVLNLLPSVLEAITPGPASLLTLLATFPHPASDAEIALCCCSPSTAASLTANDALLRLQRQQQHPCSISSDMCQLYDSGLLHFCVITRRHQVDPAVKTVVSGALMAGPGKAPKWLKRIRQVALCVSHLLESLNEPAGDVSLLS